MSTADIPKRVKLNTTANLESVVIIVDTYDMKKILILYNHCQ